MPDRSARDLDYLAATLRSFDGDDSARCSLEHQLIAAGEQLINRSLRQYNLDTQRSSLDRDRLEQELVAAVPRWEPHKGRFDQHAAYRLWGAARDRGRRNKRETLTPQFDDHVAGPTSEPLDLIPPALLSVLPTRELLVIALRTGVVADGRKRTLQQIATLLGCSRETVRRTYNAGLARLRERALA